MQKLTVLMATYNGAPYLGQQVGSIARQDTPEIRLVVSDDRSTDETLLLLNAACAGSEKINLTVLNGPGQGFVANFRNLVEQTEPDGSCFAFCDQDDIWLEAKTRKAMDWLAKVPAHVPALYCGRTRMMSETGDLLPSLSRLFVKPPSFRNAIIQSIAGGNTMTMNNAAFVLLRDSLARGEPFSHDWWTYMIVTGAGGQVFYDPQPLVYYRQHAKSLVGANNTWAGRKVRFSTAISGQFRQWNEKNLVLLEACSDLLTDENRALVAKFRTIHDGSFVHRIAALAQSGIHRQTNLGQAALFAACATGKL